MDVYGMFVKLNSCVNIRNIFLNFGLKLKNNILTNKDLVILMPTKSCKHLCKVELYSIAEIICMNVDYGLEIENEYKNDTIIQAL